MRPWSLTIQTPYLSTKRVSTMPGPKSSGRPALKLVGGSKSTLGNMNRPMAVTHPPIATVNPTHATAAQEKKPRRVTPASEAGLAAAGFAAGAGAFSVPVAAVAPVAAAALAAAAGAGFGGALAAACAGFSAAAAGPGWVTWGAFVPPATAGLSGTGLGEGVVLKVSAVAAGVSGPGTMLVRAAPASARAPSV